MNSIDDGSNDSTPSAGADARTAAAADGETGREEGDSPTDAGRPGETSGGGPATVRERRSSRDRSTPSRNLLRADVPGLDAMRDRVDWRRAGNLLGVAVLLIVLVPFVIYAVPQVVGADQSYVVLSGSMEPAIDAGDAIIVDDVEPRTIDDGDIITFERDGESTPTTHRVIDVTHSDGQPAFETKGDANDNPDRGFVSASQVRGRVLTVGGHPLSLPFVGRVVGFVGTQLGFIALVVVPAVALVVSEVWEIVAGADGSDRAKAGNTDTTTDSTAAGDPTDRIATGTVQETAGDETRPRSERVSRAEPNERQGSNAAEGGWVTVRPSELGYALAATTAFLIYSLWVAYATLTPWAIGVAASVGTAVALMGALYASSEATDSADGAAEPAAGRDAGRTARSPEPGDGLSPDAMAPLESAATDRIDPDAVAFARDSGSAPADTEPSLNTGPTLDTGPHAEADRTDPSPEPLHSHSVRAPDGDRSRVNRGRARFAELVARADFERSSRHDRSSTSAPTPAGTIGPDGDAANDGDTDA